MKNYKIYFILLVVILLFSITAVNASDMNESSKITSDENNMLSSGCIYVDGDNGNDDNDGSSQAKSIKTFTKALNLAGENDTIYLSDGVYKGLENTKLTINKSVNVYGSQNTTFDGEYTNYIFLILNNNSVTFKNINFINAYKFQPDSDLIDEYDIEGIYGSALDIKDSKVTLDNCYFKYNLVYSNNDEALYGGAISNFGDLTILNTDFYANAVGSALNNLAYGGTIYNKAKLYIKNSTFIESESYAHSCGGAIYNDGDAVMDNTTIYKSHSYEDSYGSAIFNNGNFTLLNSIIENNIIESYDSQFIYGSIFNSGYLYAKGNIFKNNTGLYKQPFTEFTGSPTIYNVGKLNLTYNSFVDNVAFNGISTDLFITGLTDCYVDDNWWMTNENPYLADKINFDVLNSWITSALTPEYSSINLNDNINLYHAWITTSGKIIPNNLMPAFNITVYTIVGSQIISKSFTTNQNISFNFNNTKNKGSFSVISQIGSVESESIIDVGKINTKITFEINNDTFYYSDKVIVKVNLYDENNNLLTKDVNLYLNDDLYNVKVINGTGNITFSKLPVNNYTLTFSFNGDSDYSKSFNSTNFQVNKFKSNLIIYPVDDIKTSDNVNLTVFLQSNEGGLGSLYINSKFITTVYLNVGNTSFNLDYFEEGFYNITVVYTGDSYYESSKSSVFFNVTKAQAYINVYCQNITAGDDEVITIEVSPSNFNSEVILSINGVNTTVLLKSTLNPITISKLSNGTYDVRVFFNGNSRFNKTNASSSFVVYRATSSLNVTVEKNNLTGKITVKTNSTKCSGIVDLFINNVHYTAILNYGTATFNVEFFKGTNYIYVFYEGDQFFNGSSWNTTIGQPVNPFFIADNITCYEYNNFTYQVILCEENGMGIPFKKIQVKVSDKYYNITTDNYGIATLVLNLKVGTYQITSFYDNINITTCISVEAIEFDAYVYNITYLDCEIVEVKFNRNITGNINFKLSNNMSNSILLNNNSAQWNISNLNSGDYTIEIFYSNDLFTSNTFIKTFKVFKADFKYEFNISGNNLGENTTILLSFSNSMTGNITLIIDSFNYVKHINNGKINLTLFNLTSGYHNLTLIYSGDDNFNNATCFERFSIRSLKTNILLEINDTVYGEKINIVAKFTGTPTGYVEFSVGSLKYVSEINEGVAILILQGMNVGNYTVNVNYMGDDFYFETSNETQFKINKAKSYIDLYVTEVYLDTNIRIYANLSSNATGVISFAMNDYYSPRNKTIINSTSSWYISPLEFGQYIINAHYYGDKNYNESDTTFILNVTQYRSILKVIIDDATNNDTVTANIRLFNEVGIGITDTVVFNFNSKSYEINVRRGIGSLVIGKLPIGKYTFTASYEGNSKYAKSTAEGKFNVVDSLINVKIDVSDFTKYVGGNDTFKFIISESGGKAISNANVKVIINNKEYDLISNSEGICEMDISLSPGSYTAVIKFNQTNRYYGAQATVNIDVLSTIRADNLTKRYGTGGQYFAIFTDCNGKALANTPVTFTINNQKYTFTTAPNGIVRIDINLKCGNYKIIAKNPASGEEIINNIYIFQYIMENKDLSFYYGANGKYTVRLFDGNGKPVGAGVNVVIKINKKTYNVKTNKKGYASFKINLKPKTYKITAKYNSFTVSNKITVKQVLSANNVMVKKGKIFKFKAKLVNSKGKALKGKKLTFKFKGRKYTAKTNKKGISVIKINQKLKVSNHKIKISYGKNSIVRIIKVIK